MLEVVRGEGVCPLKHTSGHLDQHGGAGGRGLPREWRGGLLAFPLLAQRTRRGQARIPAFPETTRAEATEWRLYAKASVRSPLVLSLRAWSQQQKLKGWVSGCKRLRLEDRKREGLAGENPQLGAGYPKARVSLEYPCGPGSAPPG